LNRDQIFELVDRSDRPGLDAAFRELSLTDLSNGPAGQPTMFAASAASTAGNVKRLVSFGQCDQVGLA
jgi:hypothetical protein